MQTYRLALLKGDGIGPEIVNEAVKVLDVVAKKYGFQVVDTAAGGYELLALSFDGTAPRFTDAARRGTIPEQELTIYYGMQCPYIHTSLEQVKRFCGERGAPVSATQRRT